MTKKLFLILALGLFISSAALSANPLAGPDDPPIWGTCPIGTTTCPTINQAPTSP
jgi:hypothetical protein